VSRALELLEHCRRLQMRPLADPGIATVMLWLGRTAVKLGRHAEAVQLGRAGKSEEKGKRDTGWRR
jgi:hypothetical protein